MMREIDTEQPVVWPEWCYNTTGESRSSVSPTSSGDQKGCGLAMGHNGTTTNGRKSTTSPQSAVLPLVNALTSSGGYQQHDLGLSFLTSTMALSANKLFKLAQQHQQQQHYRPPINPNQGTKRKHLDNAATHLSERLSPLTNDKSFNNNNLSVNNLNLDKLAHRLNGPFTEDPSYLSKNLIAQDVDNCRSPATTAALTFKSERISPINFNSGKAPPPTGDRVTTTAANMGRSRSSTPSSIAAVFNSPSNIANKNGTLGLNSNGNSNGTGQQRPSSSNNGPNELSLSRLNHRHLSNHKHHQGVQTPEIRILTENLQQSLDRPVAEPSTRNYSDMIRSLAAKYNTTNENNGQFVSPNVVGGSGQQIQINAGSSSNANSGGSRLITDRDLEPAQRNNNIHNVPGNAKPCRSPAATIASSLSNNNKALANKQSLGISAAAVNQASSTSDRSSPSVAQSSSLISSFLTGLPQSIFTPLIDMTSTQALVSLARAAKEAEFLNLLKTSSSSTAIASSPAAAAGPASSSSSPFASSLANGGTVEARKRLQTTRSVLNATNQIIHLRPKSSLFNGFASAPPSTPTPHPPSFSASRLHADGASYAVPVKVTKASSKSPYIPDKSAVISTPLDLSSGHPQGRETDYIISKKRIKIEQNVSPSSSPGPDSGIGEMITMIGSRELTSGTSSSDSESPVRRSVEESPSSRQTMEKWSTACNHKADIEEIRSWTVDQVCEFVSTIDICAEYAQNFRDQSIDGTGLPLLTEEHLRNLLSMKLGPALKLKAILSSKLGSHCQKCSSQGTALLECASPSSSFAVHGADLHLGALAGAARVSQSPNESYKRESSSPESMKARKVLGESSCDGMSPRVVTFAEPSLERSSTTNTPSHEGTQKEQ